MQARLERERSDWLALGKGVPIHSFRAEKWLRKKCTLNMYIALRLSTSFWVALFVGTHDWNWKKAISSMTHYYKQDAMPWHVFSRHCPLKRNQTDASAMIFFLRECPCEAVAIVKVEI